MATMDDNNKEHSFMEAVRQFVEAQLSGKEPDIEELVSKYPEFEHQIRQKVKEFFYVRFMTGQLRLDELPNSFFEITLLAIVVHSHH